MLKLKILPIILGLMLSSCLGLFGIYYKHNVKEKEALHQELNKLIEDVDEAKVEGAKTEIEQTQEKTVTSETLNTSPSPTVYIDPNPIIDCLKDKCGSQKVTKSACNVAVCCEIKNNVYKWTASSNECDFLKLENARQPVTLPHNSQLLYCDKTSVDAIKQASQRIKDATKGMNECLDKIARCQDEASDGYVECSQRCNSRPNLSYSECGAYCVETRGYALDICNSLTSCIGVNAGAKDTGTLDSLTNKYCD